MPNKDNQEHYQASRKDKKNSNNQKDANKKIGKMASKAAANYFTGGKGGKIVDKLANTKLGSAAMQKMGDSFVKKNPGIGKIAEKLNNAGALDLADKVDSLGNKNNQETSQTNNKIDDDSGLLKGFNGLSSLGKKTGLAKKLKNSLLNDSSQKDDVEEVDNNSTADSNTPFSFKRTH